RSSRATARSHQLTEVRCARTRRCPTNEERRSPLARWGAASGPRSAVAFFGFGWTTRPPERVALFVDVDLFTKSPALDTKLIYHINDLHRRSEAVNTRYSEGRSRLQF